MKNSVLNNILFLVFLIVIMTSCFGVKPVTSKSGGKLYESFYVGEEGNQYFIKPLNFVNEDEFITLDFTFRQKDNTEDSVLVNYSVYSHTISNELDSISIISDDVKVWLKNNKYMFSERQNGLIESRYTSKASLSEISNLFNNNNWQVVLFKKDKRSIFHTPKKIKKSISKIKFNLFDIL